MTPKLRPYQADAAAFMRTHDRALVLAKVGAGKTLISLTAMEARADVRRWLVLAPLRVCNEVWEQEHAKWGFGALPIAIATGNPARRAAAFASGARIVVANYDSIQTLPDLSSFDGIVFDELTRLKNPSGQRFKVLDKKIAHIKVRWGLTGSFVSNDLEDVFGQCKIVNPELLGRTKGAFIQQYFFVVNRDWGQYEPRPGALELVMERLKPGSYVLENKDYADTLPPLYPVPVMCELEDRKPYVQMQKKYWTEFAGREITTLTAAAASQKLCQMASGWAYYDGSDAAWYSMHKFEQLDTLLAEAEGNTLLVYNYKEELAELRRRYPGLETLDSKNAVVRWNAGEIRLLAIHPKSAAHGLNLQFGGSQVVFISLPWSLELYEQTIGRLHRSGQTKAVWVYALLTRGTIDERVWTTLQERKSLSELAIKELTT